MTFGHIFLYRIKELFRQKWCVGWNFLFPLVLATAFFVGFGSFIRNADILTTVDVAVVETQDDEMSSSFVDLVKKLDFMNVSVVDDEEAQELLKDGDVAGILYAPSFTANTRQLLRKHPGQCVICCRHAADICRKYRELVDADGGRETGILLDQ